MMPGAWRRLGMIPQLHISRCRELHLQMHPDSGLHSSLPPPGHGQAFPGPYPWLSLGFLLLFPSGTLPHSMGVILLHQP